MRIYEAIECFIKCAFMKLQSVSLNMYLLFVCFNQLRQLEQQGKTDLVLYFNICCTALMFSSTHWSTAGIFAQMQHIILHDFVDSNIGTLVSPNIPLR